MRSKLQNIAAALWRAAEETGKSGKCLDSQFAVACYVAAAGDAADRNRRLRLARRHSFPSPQETGVCRAVFGVPDTAECRSYAGKNAWHVYEFAWSYGGVRDTGRIPKASPQAIKD